MKNKKLYDSVYVSVLFSIAKPEFVHKLVSGIVKEIKRNIKNNTIPTDNGDWIIKQKIEIIIPQSNLK